MSTDPNETPQSAAIEQLERFGLSSYAAQVFVALAGLGEGTAREVSEVSAVPRTRVYDAVDELRDRGLVDVKESSPKQFWSISAETAIRTFEREFQRRTEVLRTALDEIQPTNRRVEQRGVWTVDGESAVTDRVVELLADADEEIVYMTVAELLTPELVEALSAAADRGVSIRLGGVSEEVRARIRADVADVTTFESMWGLPDTAAGRLVMVDRHRTLVSALVNGTDPASAEPRSETAIWGAGETNGLVVVLQAVFARRINGTDAG